MAMIEKYMDNISRPYQDELLKALTDPVEAAAYLNAALDEGSSELFILALQNVAKAQTMQKNMEESLQNEENAIQTSFDSGRLEFANIFETLGLRFAVGGQIR